MFIFPITSCFLLPHFLSSFPLNLTSVMSFLDPLASSQVSARRLFQLLHRLQSYTMDLTLIPPDSIAMGKEAGLWVITKSLRLYHKGIKESAEVIIVMFKVIVHSTKVIVILFPAESVQCGMSELVLPAHTEGLLAAAYGGSSSSSDEEMTSRQIISWNLNYSAWNLFGLITCSLFNSPGIGIGMCISHAQSHPLTTPLSCSDHTPSPLVDDVTAIAKLITQMLKNDWSLDPYLQPITSQYFTLLQK